MVRPALTMYANPKCPFARRAMITASEKAVDVAYEWIPLSGQLKKWKDDPSSIEELWPGKNLDDMAALKEQYKLHINETGEVPTLKVSSADGDAFVSEADVVSEYLEDAFPDSGVALLPRDALLRSKVRHYLKSINGPTGVSAMYGMLMNQDPAKDEAARDKLYSGLAKFAAMACDDGPYFLGSEFSLADVMLMPMYDQFRYALPHYRGVDFIPSDVSAYPWAARMQRWGAAVEKRESFTSFSQGREAYIAAYAGYAGERGISQVGQ